jgi:DNA-binding protein HU-beta
MTKVELISKVAETTGETKTLTTELVEAVFETIIGTVSSGEDVALHGFGKFSHKTRTGGERKYTFGDKKGETYTVKDKVVPTFSPAKAFKDKVVE